MSRRRRLLVRPCDPKLIPPPMAIVVEDALEAAQRVVGEKAHYVDILDAAIDYLRGVRDYEASSLGAALAALGHSSTTKLIPGKKIGLREREVIVCVCHGVSPYECPAIETRTLPTHGTGLRIYLDNA